MAASDYVDVELHLFGRDRARLLCSDRQEFLGDVRFDDDLYRRLLELEHARQPAKYGRELFTTVFPVGSELHRGLYSVLDGSRKEQKRLRLRLNVDSAAPAEMHALHWELLEDGKDFEVGRSPETVFSRYVSQPYALGPAPLKPRMLCVISAPIDAHRSQLAPIDYDVTRRRLEECLADLRHELEIVFLDRPVTPEKLRDRLKNGGFHLLHFHGHGTIPRRGESVLVLEDDDHKTRFTTESELGGILLGLRDLKLVTLVACHGGEPSSKDDHLSGLAGSLVRRNVPAVIAMRRAISMKLGIDFTRSLYRQLAKEPCIDAAVNEARHRLYMENPGSVEWSSPVLYMRLPDGMLWPTEKPSGSSRVPKRRFDVPRRPLILLVILSLTVAFSFLSSRADRWLAPPFEIVPHPGQDSSAVVVDRKATEADRRVPPPPPDIVYEPIVVGKIGVGVLDRDSLRWSDDIARILVRQLRAQRPQWNPVIVPAAFRSQLADLFDRDLSALKGGDRAPYGMEYLLLVGETHGDHPNPLDGLPTVTADCEMILVVLRQPGIRFDLSFSHTGKGRTTASALEQAFERCVEESADYFP